MLESLLSSDISLTAIVSAVSIIAVGVPFYRGLRIFFEARSATRVLDSSELRQAVQGDGAGRVGSIAGTHAAGAAQVPSGLLRRRNARESS